MRPKGARSNRRKRDAAPRIHPSTLQFRSARPAAQTTSLSLSRRQGRVRHRGRLAASRFPPCQGLLPACTAAPKVNESPLGRDHRPRPFRTRPPCLTLQRRAGHSSRCGSRGSPPDTLTTSHAPHTVSSSRLLGDEGSLQNHGSPPRHDVREQKVENSLGSKSLILLCDFFRSL